MLMINAGIPEISGGGGSGCCPYPGDMEGRSGGGIALMISIRIGLWIHRNSTRIPLRVDLRRLSKFYANSATS